MAATLERLERAECLRLLATAPVAWLAYCGAGRPELTPVNFAVHDGEVVVRTGYGGKLGAAAADAVMTLGVLGADPATRTGWSVTVSGHARLAGDPLVDADLPEPGSWVDGRVVTIAVAIERVSGRRIVRPGSRRPPGGPGPRP